MHAAHRHLCALLLPALLATSCGRTWPITHAPPPNPTICCFGDSLVVGYGAEQKESYPAVIAELTKQTVTSWGVSGETTGQALARTKKFKGRSFGLVIVTLGGNDILQRVAWADTERNLRTIFTDIQASGAVVAFTGVNGPLSVGLTDKYRNLCRSQGVYFIPDILAGILTNTDLKSDEIHPNAKGYRLMAERIVAALQKGHLL